MIFLHSYLNDHRKNGKQQINIDVSWIMFIEKLARTSLCSVKPGNVQALFQQLGEESKPTGEGKKRVTFSSQLCEIAHEMAKLVLNWESFMVGSINVYFL